MWMVRFYVSRRFQGSCAGEDVPSKRTLRCVVVNGNIGMFQKGSEVFPLVLNVLQRFVYWAFGYGFWQFCIDPLFELLGPFSTKCIPNMGSFCFAHQPSCSFFHGQFSNLYETHHPTWVIIPGLDLWFCPDYQPSPYLRERTGSLKVQLGYV